ERCAVPLGKTKARPSGVFASRGTNRNNSDGWPFVHAIQQAAHFDSASRQFLESLGDLVPDLLDHHQGILDGYRAGSGIPGPELDIAHAWISYAEAAPPAAVRAAESA